MSSISLRKVATAVVLLATLCLAAAPVAAQSRGKHEAAQIETDFASRVWLWLVEVLGSKDTGHALKKSQMQTSSDQSYAPGVLSRGGTYDPNG